MRFLQRFSFTAQSVLLSFCLFLTGQSHAMLSLPEKQIAYNKNRKDRLFIKDFSNMTIVQASERFGNCSPMLQKSIVRMVAKKDKDNKNELFSTVFCMATQLPKDLRKLILNKEMFGGNTAATKKFLTMPIGKAIEWYALCQEASRGKLIYLPIFKQKLRGQGLISLPRPLRIHLVDGKDQGFEIFFDNGKIATLDTNRLLNGLYNGDSSCCNDILNDFLDDTTGIFFQLSMNDILLLMDYDENMHYRGKSVTLNDLKQLVTIEKIIPFLKDGHRTIHYIKEYSRADVIDFVKIGAKNGAKYVFPVLAVPLCCARLSKVIQTKFCQKVWIDYISENNAYILEKICKLDLSIINVLKIGNINSNLLSEMYLDREELVFLLRSPMRYGFADSLKMILPLFLTIPLSMSAAYKVAGRDWKQDGAAVGSFLFLGSACFFHSLFVQDSKSFAISMCGAAALSVFSGVLWSLGKEYFSYESRVNGILKTSDIEELLKHHDAKKIK